MTEAESSAILDRVEALRRVRGNSKLYRDLIRVFLGDLPRLVGRLQAAIEAGSAKDLHLAAHSLKGSASHLGAKAVVESAWVLEKMAQGGDLTGAANSLQRLEQDLQVLTPLLQSLASDPQAASPTHESKPHSPE